jgi:hypothetical protein
MHDEVRLQQVPRTDIHADRDMKAGLAPNFDLGQRSLDGPFPTSIPSGWFSMMGMKEAGDNKPRVGCCQRIKASAPSTSPVRMLTLGWK